MLVLILGLIIFFGMHSVRIFAPGLREAQAQANLMRWKGIYSLISAAGFVLIIWGYILYRPEAPQLYTPPEWGRSIALPLLPIALILLAASNPRVGRIKATIQHPMLAGIALWAIAHLLVNGDAAGVLIFGVALVYAVLDTISAVRRGEPAPQFQGYRGDITAILSGLVLTAILLFGLHALLFGVSPLG